MTSTQTRAAVVASHPYIVSLTHSKIVSDLQNNCLTFVRFLLYPIHMKKITLSQECIPGRNL
jgi:hypothetical protein